MATATLLLVTVLAAAGTPEIRPWRADPLFRQIQERLDSLRAIDNHTHLLAKGRFNPKMDAMMPLGLRSTYPEYADALRARFGVAVEGDMAAAAARATAAREAMVARLGKAGYWKHHLDDTRTEIALVNQDFPDGTDGKRLRWVAHATNLLYPLPAEALMVRSPKHRSGITEIQSNLQRFLSEAGLGEAPPDLASYVRFVESTLSRWKEQGAVGVKFWDAYLRTLVFEDVPQERAAALYAKGSKTPLTREEYLAVQDFLAHRIFAAAGERKLAVHIHSSHGVPPFLRTAEADVRNLDSVLTDVRYFGTPFVLIHGGAPEIEHAAYLALKPHVWYDMSAMPFLYPVPQLADVLGKVLTFAPEKLLFATDVGAYPGIPVGPEVQHMAASRAGREALALALAGLVRDGLVDLETAVRMGENALRGNAERLYGWSAGPKP
jgi:predicted TIM-barrel fold metal-dependent hydrolase